MVFLRCRDGGESALRLFLGVRCLLLRFIHIELLSLGKVLFMRGTLFK
jgi:hypothetical protein